MYRVVIGSRINFKNFLFRLQRIGKLMNILYLNKQYCKPSSFLIEGKALRGFATIFQILANVVLLLASVVYIQGMWPPRKIPTFFPGLRKS